MEAAVSCSLGPAGKAQRPRASRRSFAARPNLRSPRIARSSSIPADIENVKKVQAGYKVQPLSAFLGQPAPKAAPAIDFIKPLTPAEEKTSPQFFNILNFVLQFCPTVPSETELMARFARIGVGAGKIFDAEQALARDEDGHRAGHGRRLGCLRWPEERIEEGKVTAGDVFGTRQYLKNNYLYRMAAAVLGIYGNSKQEAMYPAYYVDATKQKLDGANRYSLALCAGPVATSQRVLVADDV